MPTDARTVVDPAEPPVAAATPAAAAAATPASRGAGIWLGMLVLYVVWGSTYLGIAVAVDTIPPFLMAAVRFALAGAALLLWSVARGRSTFAWPTRREWRDSAIVGGLLLGGGMGLVSFGETKIGSGVAALLIAMMPVWVAIFGRILLGERLPRLAVFGIAVGFCGVAVLAGPTALGSAGALDPLRLAALIISPISWSIGSLYASHRATLPRRPLTATAAQMLSGAFVLMVMSGLSGEFGRFSSASVTTDSLIALGYLTLVGSLLAFTTFGWLLRKAPLPLVATYAYVNPVVAVALGALVRHEAVDARTIVAGAIIVLAVAVIVTARGRMQRPVDRQSPGGDTAALAAAAPAVEPA